VTYRISGGAGIALKTAIDKPGKDLKRLKEAVRPAEAEMPRFVDACDELRDATRRR
jgi:hypothetical protein